MIVVGKWSCWHVLSFSFIYPESLLLSSSFFTSTKGYILPFYLSFFLRLQVMLFQEYHCSFAEFPVTDGVICQIPDLCLLFYSLMLNILFMGVILSLLYLYFLFISFPWSVLRLPFHCSPPQ